MNETPEFLKFLINEDIYAIDEKELKEVVEQNEEPEDIADSDDLAESPSPVPATRTNEILILFRNEKDKDLPENDLNYLEKILGAIGIAIQAVDFQNVAKTEPDTEGYKYLFVFTSQLALTMESEVPKYSIITYNKAQLIAADELNVIAASTELRKKLWGVLKSEFVK